MSKKKRTKQTAFDQRNTHLPSIEEKKADPQVKATILEIVENQISANDPPETLQTLERLMAAGYKRHQAVEMIGAVVVEEVWMVLHESKESEHERFVARLEKLS